MVATSPLNMHCLNVVILVSLQRNPLGCFAAQDVEIVTVTGVLIGAID